MDDELHVIPKRIRNFGWKKKNTITRKKLSISLMVSEISSVIILEVKKELIYKS